MDILLLITWIAYSAAIVMGIILFVFLLRFLWSVPVQLRRIAAALEIQNENLEE